MPTTPANDEPIRTQDDLLQVFHEAVESYSVPRIGPELEKCGVHTDAFIPITYEGSS